MDIPETKFAKLGEDRIAYQVLGDGPIDLLYLGSPGESLDVRWDWPPLADYLRRLASFSRLITFDRRGSGASDPISFGGLSPWEQWADDARAVLDEVGSEQAAIVGVQDQATTAMMFAATEPKRTRALVLFNAAARTSFADDYPWANPVEFNQQIVQSVATMWGTDAIVDLAIPSMVEDKAFRRWVARATRASFSARAYGEYLTQSVRMDVRHVLPLIAVPTLVLHRKEYPFFSVEDAQYLADNIPGGVLVLVPGRDAIMFTEGTSELLDTIEEFLTGTHAVQEPDRVLAAVLFTDIVGSTERAAALGDRRWKELLQSHDLLAETIIEQHRGKFVKSTGDGILATFDGPGRAIRCARAFQESLRPLGLEIRMGLHTGEVELRGADIGGIGVHVAARVLEHAAANEFLASAAVPLLVAGSGIEFDDRGEHPLKGIPGDWRLFAVKA